MNAYKAYGLPESDKKKLIEILTDELPSLRAKLGMSQSELSSIIGISRQTYNAIETRKRTMSWSTFLSLLLMFDSNGKTRDYIYKVCPFPMDLKNILFDNHKENSNEQFDN